MSREGDASYGYDGYYVDLSEYRISFSTVHGSQFTIHCPGYYSRSQYGRYSNGTGSILSTMLQKILNLQLVN